MVETKIVYYLRRMASNIDDFLQYELKDNGQSRTYTTIFTIGNMSYTLIETDNVCNVSSLQCDYFTLRLECEDFSISVICHEDKKPELDSIRGSADDILQLFTVVGITYPGMFED